VRFSFAAPEGAHRGLVGLDDITDADIIDMGRSHSGGHAFGMDKAGSLLPNISHNHKQMMGGNYKQSYGSASNGIGLADSLSRSPSAGLSGRVDWKSKYLK
jgi:hypothetical protein